MQAGLGKVRIEELPAFTKIYRIRIHSAYRKKWKVAIF